MLSRIGIVCFAGSYLLVLLLELSRLLFRSGIRGAAMLALAAAGLFAHTIYLYYRAVQSHAIPLSSPRDWYLVAAWVLVAVYLLLLYYHPKTPFGLILIPLVLWLSAAGAMADPFPFERGPASRGWGLIHASSILVAAVAVLLAFTAGLLYLYQSHRLKQKRPRGEGLQLPSLEWLQRANSRSIVLAVLMMAVGVLSGTILNLINQSEGGRLPWGDPLVLVTVAMLVWLAFAALVGGIYRPIRQGRKVVYLTFVCFVFLVSALTVGLMFRTEHGGRRGDAWKVRTDATATDRL